MVRIVQTICVFSILAACERSGSKDRGVDGSVASAPVVGAPVASAPIASAASARPLPCSQARAATSRNGCAPFLKWAKDGKTSAPLSFSGRIGRAQCTNAGGATETFETLEFEKPLCGPDGTTFDDGQLEPSAAAKGIDVAKNVGKAADIEGRAVTASADRHHRAIVIEVKTLTVLE